MKKFIALFKNLQFFKKESEEDKKLRLMQIEKENKIQSHIADLLEVEQFDKVLELVESGSRITSEKNMNFISKKLTNLLLVNNQSILELLKKEQDIDETKIERAIKHRNDASNLIKIVTIDKALRKEFYQTYSYKSTFWKIESSDSLYNISQKLKYNHMYNCNIESSLLHYFYFESFKTNSKPGDEFSLSLKNDNKYSQEFFNLFFTMIKENIDTDKKFNFAFPVEFLWAFHEFEKNKDGALFFNDEKRVKKLINLTTSFYHGNLYSSLIKNETFQNLHKTFFYNFIEKTIFQKNSLVSVHQEILNSLKNDQLKETTDILKIAEIYNVPSLLKLQLNIIKSQITYFDESQNVPPEISHYIQSQQVNIIDILENYQNISSISTSSDELTNKISSILENISEELKTFIQSHEKNKLNLLENNQKMLKNQIKP